MQLIFVRHGQPQVVITEDGSPADPPLSEIGNSQAQAMAQLLQEEQIDGLYVSPMKRALGTVAPLAVALGLTPLVRTGLSEFDKNSTSYIPMEILKEQDRVAWEKLNTEFDSSKNSRLQRFLTETVAAIEEIVGENAVINSYLAHCLQYSSTNFMKFNVDYTSVTRVLASPAGHRSVLSVNERTHFRGKPELMLS
ncbi:MAG: histidine phosphatase family protein [Acidimicrobiales bacterium]